MRSTNSSIAPRRTCDPAESDMAKFKPAKAKKKSAPTKALGVIPCLVVVIGVMGLVTLLFFLALKG